MTDLDSELRRGIEAARTGDYSRAIESFGRVVAANPAHRAARRYLGMARLAVGETSAAANDLGEAVRLGAADAETWTLLGQARLACGSPDAALEAFNRALERTPGHAPALNSRGVALERLGRDVEAIATLRTLVAAAPGHAEALYNLGVIYLRRDALAEAEDALRAALAIGPAHAPTLVNLGIVRRRQGDPSGAIALLEQALRAEPGRAEAWIALGSAHQESGQPDQAATDFARALMLDPRDRDAAMNLGMALLQRGEFAKGWALYEARPYSPLTEVVARTLGARGIAPWLGAALDGPLALVAEQGLGDTIQFMRLATLVRGRSRGCVLLCDRRLRWLAESTGFFERVVAFEEAATVEARAWCRLLSLPHLLRVGPAGFATGCPYGAPRPEILERWRRSVPQPAGTVRIGLAWQGNPAAETDALRGRSVPLNAFAPVAELPGIMLIPLQVGCGTEQVDNAPFAERLFRTGPIDVGDEAFADTAALVSLCDLVIASDSAVAHLAATFGRPVWIALSAHPEWRWMLSRRDSPWYPTARLFRQQRPGDWSDVFAEIRQELAAGLRARAVGSVGGQT